MFSLEKIVKVRGRKRQKMVYLRHTFRYTMCAQVHVCMINVEWETESVFGESVCVCGATFGREKGEVNQPF